MTFSAGPQATGYLFQARYALLALLRQVRDEASVVIEGLDDIEVHPGDEPLTLEQLKHHVMGQAALTNTCPDLWRTLRVWSTSLADERWDPDEVRLHLVTTATASRGSAAWHLKSAEHADRDIEKAWQLLCTAMATSTATVGSLRSAFAAFEALGPTNQHRLLEAVTVIDDAPAILDLQGLIRQTLRFTAPDEKLDGICESIEGWWFAQVVEHLVSGSREPLTLLDLRRKIWSIAVRYMDDNLPVDCADALPETVLDADNDSRLFVQQLRLLRLQRDRMQLAMLDFYRASTQRSQWVRNQLLVDDELARYERKLVEEWQRMRLILEGRMSLPSDDACISMGRELLDWMETQAKFKIRSKVEEDFVMRGTYHILANTDPPRVYWHPKAMEHLERILLAS